MTIDKREGKEAREKTEIEPFTILKSYDVLLYTSCRSACLPREVPTYLRSKHRALSPMPRGSLVDFNGFFVRGRPGHPGGARGTGG